MGSIKAKFPNTDNKIWYRNDNKWQNKATNGFRNKKSRFDCFCFEIPHTHFVLEISFFNGIADKFVAIIESRVWTLKAHCILKITWKDFIENIVRNKKWKQMHADEINALFERLLAR